MSTVPLAGLSIITYVHSTLGGSGRRLHNSDVLMHALLTPDALLSTGVMTLVAGYIPSIVNVNRSASHSLKSSADVTLSQVRDVNKCSLTKLFLSLNCKSYFECTLCIFLNSDL